MGKSFQGKFSASLAIMSLNAFLSRDRGDLSPSNQKYSCWTADFIHWDLKGVLLRDHRLCQYKE